MTSLISDQTHWSSHSIFDNEAEGIVVTPALKPVKRPDYSIVFWSVQCTVDRYLR